ncbi:Uncharacterised protein [Vibrio cholerae]|nr:Uncharacterised protein [Vibrio cholerae]
MMVFNNTFRLEILIFRRRHLVASRLVNPDLEAVQLPFLHNRHFTVDHATSCCHPLRAAGS